MLGTTIGSYLVRAKVGEGGMGTVYLAEHTTLGRRAAIKVLQPEMSHERTIVARFFNEARAASTIHHPSIVEIYDFGYTPDGNAFIVMEYLAGETLAHRCRRVGRFDVPRALQLCRQIAGGLSAAHERNIVHRDLKPENIYLVPDPDIVGGERAKLLDFGIAKLQRDVHDTSRTQTGSVLGTPAYMAPEQCRGSGEVDSRADLYALGCVLYEMLLGRPPFTADGAGDLIAHHLYFEPQPPRQLDPSLSESIERLVMWLLRKDPAKRPQTAHELIAEIDRLDLRTGDYAARPSSPTGPAPVVPKPTTLSGASLSVQMRTPAARRRRFVVPLVAITATAAGIAIYFAVAASAGHGAGDTTPPAPEPAAPIRVEPKPEPTPTPVTAPEPAKPPPVTLTIESDPSGATVLRDGKPVGTTPFVETVPTGDHTARTYIVRKDGYEPANTTLPVEHDGSDKVVLKKKKARPATTHTVGDKGVNPFD